jgi:zinc/manganese transport system permease protein
MDSLSLSIIAPAFAAGFLILLTHIPLGREVVKRGIIFIDLAVAQIAGLGIIFASYCGLDEHGWQLQAVAFSSAVIGALSLSYLEKFAGDFYEAVIGITFVLAATAGILLLSSDPHGGENLKDLLVGQILWVSWQQLILPAAMSILVLGLWWRNSAIFKGKLFYVLFAIAITQSVQLVGVYLVFSSLIIPALVTFHLNDKRAIGAGITLGTAAYALGLITSAITDLPSGAVIVWALLSVALMFKIVARIFDRQGVN